MDERYKIIFVQQKNKEFSFIDRVIFIVRKEYWVPTIVDGGYL